MSSGRALAQQYAFPFAAAQFNIAHFRFPRPSLSTPSDRQQKKDRGFRPRSKSGRKRPGTGSDSGELSLTPVSQIEKSGALTELNFAQPIINTLVDPTLLDGIDLTHEALDPA
jgi:hypothetical protein